ncbi:MULTISPECIES: ABC transporter substrate-binding protein [unclassified Paenibacillus]|nr:MULTISPECIES: extracellular solute-binding protein [unclassified Paenibacillus]SDG08317.1 multiple sugar transport system substrate-binding protein [Paenibacillus sp. cl6col]
MRTSWKMGIMLLIIMLLVSGCFGRESEVETFNKVKGTIRVVYQDKEAFYRDYGQLFKLKQPDIDVEVVSKSELYSKFGDPEFDFEKESQKLLDKYKPDVLLLDETSFKEFAQGGKLYAIDGVIKRDRYDIEGFMPGLTDRLKAMGKGTLYGLSPTIDTTVLYYNRDIFKEHNIEPPRNQMSWREFFELATSISNAGGTDKHLYALAQEYGGADSLMYEIASSTGLRLFDTKGEQLLINSEGWKVAIQQATDAVRSKALYIPPANKGPQPIEPEKGLFFTGKAAMKLGRPWDLAHLRNKKAEKINWDVVTAPIDPATPDETGNITIHEIYAIAADSGNKEAAWELVKFINGTEMAKVAARTTVGMIPTIPSRPEYFKELDGRSTEAFYALKLKELSALDALWGNKNVPDDFNSSFWLLLSEALQSIIDNKKSVDEAVNELQTKGQEALRVAHDLAQEKRLRGKDNK